MAFGSDKGTIQICNVLQNAALEDTENVKKLSLTLSSKQSGTGLSLQHRFCIKKILEKRRKGN